MLVVAVGAGGQQVHRRGHRGARSGSPFHRRSAHAGYPGTGIMITFLELYCKRCSSIEKLFFDNFFYLPKLLQTDSDSQFFGGSIFKMKCNIGLWCLP